MFARPASSKTILNEARRKVRKNTLALRRAKSSGTGAYATRVAEREPLSAAKISDLLVPDRSCCGRP